MFSVQKEIRVVVCLRAFVMIRRSVVGVASV